MQSTPNGFDNKHDKVVAKNRPYLNRMEWIKMLVCMCWMVHAKWAHIEYIDLLGLR